MADGPPTRDAALSAIDAAISRKPVRDGHLFSAALEQTCAFRDRLIAENGAPDARKAVNVMISALLAGQYPASNVPWSLVEAARSQFADARPLPSG